MERSFIQLNGQARSDKSISFKNDKKIKSFNLTLRSKYGNIKIRTAFISCKVVTNIYHGIFNFGLVYLTYVNYNFVTNSADTHGVLILDILRLDRGDFHLSSNQILDQKG